MIFRVAWESIRYRFSTLIWVWLILVLALTTVSAMQRIAEGAKQGFLASARGVDLVVGQPDGNAQMVLGSIFMLGVPGGGLSADDQRQISQLEDIKRAVPIALGDSHRGFPVIATHIHELLLTRQSAQGQPLTLAEGEVADRWDAVVIGSQMAEELGYQVGQTIRLAHGQGTGLESSHAETFLVSGVLAPSGTPLDRAVLATTEADRILHKDFIGGGSGRATALLVQSHRKVGVFRLQGEIERVTQGRAKAVIPGLALTELWRVFGVVEQAGRWMAAMVLGFAVIAMFGLSVIQARQRQRELWVLRSMGARRAYVAGLQMVEGIILGVAAILGATGLIAGVTAVVEPFFAQQFGIDLKGQWLAPADVGLAVGCLVLCIIGALTPIIVGNGRNVSRGLTESTE